MPKNSPQPLNAIQIQRLSAFLINSPPTTLSIFWSKWDLPREELARICYIDTRTLNRYLARGNNREQNNPTLNWYITLVDIILEHFDDLPTNLQVILCPEITNDDV